MRLELDSKDYDRKLAEAKKKIRDFSKGGGTDIAALAGKFKTVAGAIAASKAAMETFNAVIQSSQTIGDAYTRVLESAKGAVNEFVYAMANADFSGFNGGLKGIMQNARDAATAMDSLGNAQISYDYLTAGYRSDFKTAMGTAKDKSLGLGERQAAFAAAQASLDKIGEAVQVYSDKAIAAVVANAAAKGNNVNKDFITRENINRIFELDLSANGEAEKKALQERYEEFKKLKKQEEKLESIAHNARMNGYASAEKYEQQLADIRAKINSDDMQLAALYNAMLVKGTDEWLKGLSDLLVKVDNANASYQELKTSILEIAQNLKSAAESQGKLTMSGEQYAEHFGMNYYNTLGAKPATIHEDVEIIDTTLEDEALPAVVAYTEALETLAATEVSVSEGIGQLGGAISSISGLLDEQAGAWVDYAGNVVSAIGSAVPALESLAAAQAAAALTKTALSPWTVVSALAAVTSIGVAMANVPKFATGGIVPGSSYYGDNVLIRANSGERVLTREQNAMWESGMGMFGKVVFKIEGGNLVGVLNNNQKVAALNYGH